MSTYNSFRLEEFKMSIVKCEDCHCQFDLDSEEGYAISDTNTFLCDKCSLKEDDRPIFRTATREEIDNHHQDEYMAGLL